MLQKISEEVSVLRNQIAELVEVTRNNEVLHKVAPNLEEAIKSVSSFSPQRVSNIETDLSELTQKISELLDVSKDRNKEVQSPQELPEELTSLIESFKKTETALSGLTNQVTEIKTTIDCHKQPPIHRTDIGSGIQKTLSPHAKKVVTPCKPYIKYEGGIISPEMKNDIL